MAFQFHKIKGWTGLANRRDPRDIGNGLSKAQNISLDVGGKVRTIGGLADFTKVDGATALTQTAKLCPGSGLFPYGSDHWRGTDTIVDLGPDNNAASDNQTEADATTGWNAQTLMTLNSVADTDPDNGGTIATNGTTYIIKFVVTTGPNTRAAYTDAITVVAGQKYKVHADLYCRTAASINLQVRIAGGDPIVTGVYNGAASWVESEVEFVAPSTSITVYIYTTVTDDNQIAYFDDVYLTATPRSDLDTNWLALADVATAQVDLYNVNDDSFTAGLLDFGTVSSYVATIDTINFPTTKTITDSTSRFLNQGVQIGDIRIISGSALNNIMFVVEHVTTGTITARGNPFVVDADDDGTVTLTKYNPVAFHYVNEALRASPANGGIALRPKHYSFVDRTHFEGANASERKFSNWFLNDVGPVAPTDVEATTGNGDGAATNLTAGAGFEIGITRTADDGDWIAGTYIIACAFRYDDDQVSALFVPSTDEEFGTTILDSDSLTLTVRAKNDYDERISGGYIFCRKDESDDAWILLAEISMAKGARATLLGTYNAWAESSTVDVAYTANFKSLHPNVDSYESISGIDPTTSVGVFTGDNAFWNTSVIARNRCFIGSVRYTAEGGALSHFRDRILYSTVGAFDTFPIDNYIDVVQGDAEDYKKLGTYGNVILAFKESTLYLIDISDPDPAGWQMVQDANKGKYPFRGIAHPGAYFETPVGPAWCNKFGVFLYNGSEIVPLLGDKIELSEHPLAHQRYMEFDGTDDYVSVADDADLDFGTGDGSIEAIVQVVDNTASAYFYTRYESANDYFVFYYNVTLGVLIANIALVDGTVVHDARCAWTPTNNTWYHVTWTFENGVSNALYINGVSQTLSTDTKTGGTMDIASALEIGKQSTLYEELKAAMLHQWNRKLTTAEVLALANGQPVLAADRDGSQTELVTDGDMSNAASWSVGSPWTVDDGGSDVAHYEADGIAKIEQAMAVGFTIAKNYGVRFTISNAASGAQIAIYSDVGTVEHLAYDTYANGTHYVEFAAASTTTDLEIWANAAPGSFDLDDLSIVQIGCVAEYAPKGIGDATWEDQSDNSLDGTVVGATAIFEDSWAKFYTDYSILGYQALTNLIIIMRDCTGKWSSGQDYGDAFLIDMDTGAVTTGRRIFTKGIAYSNWATDWAQNLIIAEQTSSTSVTIKKWTDEPQSQAIGLIDIRTADIDFGNPAYAKIFDALVAYYKSSAAQTTPFSYALDGDDRHVAWTRITGNFTAEEFWEKLPLEPTAFECDTIRFKLDNPTAAGIMELNDLTLRYSEETEDID